MLTTVTTHWADPRPGLPGAADWLVLRPVMELPAAGASLKAGSGAPDHGTARRDASPLAGDLVPHPGAASPSGDAPLDLHPRGGVTALASGEGREPGKLKGIHPSWIPVLRLGWDAVLVEADGARRLPVKAPGPGEPVLPPDAGLVVVGVVGLDCLGRPMDERTVHRPERFAAVTGCRPGAAIGWEHLAALALHPEGLFKGAGPRRLLLLNKFDGAAGTPAEAARSAAGSRPGACAR